MAEVATDVSRRRRTAPSRFHGPLNLIAQALTVAMIALTCLLVIPWPFVLGWTLATLAATFMEDRLLSRADAGAGSKWTARLAAALRAAVTILFAVAALVLIASKASGPGERMFGFAIISAAMVHVLMRHFRSPIALAISMVPWIGILGVIVFGLTSSALQAGDLHRAATSTFVFGIFGLEFWSARQQLSASWRELTATLIEVTQAEAALKDTQRIAKIGSWRLASGAAHLESSEELDRIFGFDPADGPPTIETVMTRLDEDSRARLRAMLEAQLPEPFTFSLQVRHPDGSARACWVQGRPEFDARGVRLGASGFCQDVTEREAATAQLRQAQKMESVGQLTGGLAHDFNNLLAIIIGNLDLIATDLPDKSEGKEFADTALQAALKGSELTQQLLAFSRRQPLDPKTVDVKQLVFGMAPLWRRTLGENVVVKLVISDDTWAAKLDRAQMESSLLNLVINARDAMPQGGVLTVETGNATIDPENPELPPGDYAVVAVSDTGHGMSADILAKVVEPFFTTKGVGKGSGLGLSMIYGFAKQSGGQLRIYSEEGHGTTVRLYLPRSMDAVAAQQAGAAGPVRGNGERILVVEDNPDVRRVAVRQVAELGYRVVEADSGAAALEVLALDHGVELVFSDIVMPGMTGIEMVQAARRDRPDLKALFTTGFTSAAAASNSRVTGADMMISKPYRISELATKLRDALAGAAGDDGDDPRVSPRRAG